MDCTNKLKMLGFAGIAPQVSLATHNDHNTGEGSAPPVGRGLETRLSCIDRVQAIKTQGGEAVLAKMRDLRKSALPKRHPDKMPDPKGGDKMDPANGSETVDKTSLTLGIVQDELRDTLLNEGVKAAKQYAGSIIAVYPHWAIALTKQLEFEMLTRGIK